MQQIAQQQQQSIARLFQERSVQEEIQIAYEAFIRFVPRRPASAPFQWQPPAHRCEDTCDFFQYRNVNICKATANWHYCTEQTCDRMIRTHERQVCPLSGMAYDLELDTGADLCDYQRASAGGGGGGGGNDIFDETADEATATRENEEERTTTNADMEEYDSDMQGPETEEGEASRRVPTPPRGEPHNEGFNEGEHHSRIALFESIMSHIFAAHVHTHRSLFHSIAVNAERIWMLMQGSATLAQKKRRYQPEYHLLAILYNMCQGYDCMKHNIVPFNQWVKNNIPQVRHLKRLSVSTGEIKVKNFTQASKLFRVCMTELLKRQSDRRELLERLQWIT